jgi:phenylacetate-coenzyme A ligase PaaK-like adenylate-forming protein
VDDDLESLLGLEQYSLGTQAKESMLLRGLNELTLHHAERCVAYARILEASGQDPVACARLDEVPYLPVSLFKWTRLASVPDDEIFKVMTSSGTTSQVPSRVYLDIETARLQTRALSSIVTHFLGPRRRPMLIIDHPGVIGDSRQLTARGAGILGMLSYGRDHLYVLDDQMRLDREALGAWLDRHAGEELLVFGFTFMVWEYFCEQLAGAGVDLSRATLVHSGGWKKLADVRVDAPAFKARLRETIGLEDVHDFYGMVEQVGSVFFECEAGYLHPPNFADVLIRDAGSWEPATVGTAGVVEVLSLLPRSYPGHALLTEDLGIIHGVDDCRCGRNGRRFTIIGRIAKSEIRGCSDTHERRA